MAVEQAEPGALRYNPWRDAGERYPDWLIRRVDLQGLTEVTCTRRQIILLDKEMRYARRRCALAHAIAHLDLEHTPVGLEYEAWQEREADKLAARRLIPIHALADALRWSRVTAEIASELDVDVDMLCARVDIVHPSEAAVLRRAVAHHHP